MTDTDSNARWYALHVRTNYEMEVTTRLKNLGIVEYLPINRHLKPSQRNRFPFGLPLFPGYVFSFLDLHSGPRLYTVPGVIRILGHGGQAIPLEDSEIEMIRSITASSLQVEAIPYFQSGDRVCLIAGPLAGVRGTFVSSVKGNKLVVSLPLLRRSLAITVLSEWVIAELPDHLLAEVRAN